MTLMIIVHAFVKEIALIIKSENSCLVQWDMWLQVTIVDKLGNFDQL